MSTYILFFIIIILIVTIFYIYSDYNKLKLRLLSKILIDLKNQNRGNL